MDIELLKRVMQKDYVPIDSDVLACRIKTTGRTRMNFIHDAIEYEVIDVGGQRAERKRWMNHMKDVDMLIYVISLSDYDECLYEDEDETSRMVEAMQVFPKTIQGEWFDNIPVLVFWNKKEALEQKLGRINPSNIFSDYPQGEISLEKCIEFIQAKFLEQIPQNYQRRMTHVSGSAIYGDSIGKLFDEVVKTTHELKKI